jgi:hypothetical protein
MPTTAGDKLSLPVPTAGGDTGTWGGYMNSDTWPVLDELCYAAREDRNLVIMGGGKIGWNGAQVTFTADIIVYNHVTGFTVTIQAAGSPVALGASGTVGYVKINRKPSVNQTIAAVSTAAAGSLPNTLSDADMGVLVLFMRTADGTLWVPWARREILSQDHWQFGIAKSWFERIASSRKPRYQSVQADTSQIVVPGSASSPSVVVIDGKLYANTADKTLDMDTTGRNGLDTGAKAADTIYYLYAIPPTSGRGFDLVCSITAPTTGPTGFPSWNYLGAFGTIAASAVVRFMASNGHVRFGEAPSSAYISAVTNASPLASKTLKVPITARTAVVLVYWSAINATGDLCNWASESAGTEQTLLRAAAATTTSHIRPFYQLPLTTAQTAWFRVSTATTDNASVSVHGWIEDPMEWQ